MPAAQIIGSGAGIRKCSIAAIAAHGPLTSLRYPTAQDEIAVTPTKARNAMTASTGAPSHTEAGTAAPRQCHPDKRIRTTIAPLGGDGSQTPASMPAFGVD